MDSWFQAVRRCDTTCRILWYLFSMSAWVASRILIPALLVVPAGLGLTGCGGSAGKLSVPSSSAAEQSCSWTSVVAQIGGEPKCLQTGQQCQSRWSADYAKYGFECTKNGSKYVLGKK